MQSGMEAEHWNLEARAKKVKEALKGTKVLSPLNMNLSERETFELVQNPAYWKEPTIPAIVNTKIEADKLSSAINSYAGGSEVEDIGGQSFHRFLVTSKGYYHYIGA